MSESKYFSDSKLLNHFNVWIFILFCTCQTSNMWNLSYTSIILVFGISFWVEVPLGVLRIHFKDTEMATYQGLK